MIMKPLNLPEMTNGVMEEMIQRNSQIFLNASQLRWAWVTMSRPVFQAVRSSWTRAVHLPTLGGSRGLRGASCTLPFGPRRPSGAGKEGVTGRWR